MKNNEAWSDGPWFTTSARPDCVDRDCGEGLCQSLVECFGESSTGNASLISVAPELVEGIEAFKKWVLEFRGEPAEFGDREWALNDTYEKLNAIFQPLLDRARGVE